MPLIAGRRRVAGRHPPGRPAGSFGRAAAVSFNGNKIMTTWGGGMLLTDDAALADAVRYLARRPRQPVTHYEHTEIGYNYRLSNLLAAFGSAQLVRLPDMLRRRRAIREHYRELFAGQPGIRLLGGDDSEDNCWLTSIVVEPEVAGWKAGDLSAWSATTTSRARPCGSPCTSSRRSPTARPS